MRRANRLSTLTDVGLCTVTIAVYLLLCLSWPLDGWLRAFVKLEEMRLPYIITFSVIISLVLIVSRGYVCRISMFASIIYGAIVGQIASTISITVANLFIPNGVNRTIRAIEKFGIQDILLIDLVVAFVLGGWLLGAAGFALFRLGTQKIVQHIDK